MIASSFTTVTHSEAPLLPSGALRAFVLVIGLFLPWGISNNLNDVLIRQFMKSFALCRFQAGLVRSALYLDYFLLTLSAGLPMRRKGNKSGFVTGLVLSSAGCLLFWPAAQSGRYAAFLLVLFVVASGLAFLETAANPFVAQLGPTSSTEARLNLAQAFNPMGAIFGVLLGTRFIFSGIELFRLQVARVQSADTYTSSSTPSSTTKCARTADRGGRWANDAFMRSRRIATASPVTSQQSVRTAYPPLVFAYVISPSSLALSASLSLLNHSAKLFVRQ